MGTRTRIMSHVTGGVSVDPQRFLREMQMAACGDGPLPGPPSRAAEQPGHDEAPTDKRRVFTETSESPCLSREHESNVDAVFDHFDTDQVSIQCFFVLTTSVLLKDGVIGRQEWERATQSSTISLSCAHQWHHPETGH